MSYRNLILLSHHLVFSSALKTVVNVIPIKVKLDHATNAVQAIKRSKNLVYLSAAKRTSIVTTLAKSVWIQIQISVWNAMTMHQYLIYSPHWILGIVIVMTTICQPRTHPNVTLIVIKNVTPVQARRSTSVQAAKMGSNWMERDLLIVNVSVTIHVRPVLVQI